MPSPCGGVVDLPHELWYILPGALASSSEETNQGAPKSSGYGTLLDII